MLLILFLLKLELAIFYILKLLYIEFLLCLTVSQSIIQKYEVLLKYLLWLFKSLFYKLKLIN